MKALFVAVCATVVLGGCAVQAPLIPTGGSRADGTIKLSYEYNKFQVPKVDYAGGLESAKARCAAWGYTGAEAFGGGTKTCSEPAMGGCNVFRVTLEYQCTGNPPPRN